MHSNPRSSIGGASQRHDCEQSQSSKTVSASYLNKDELKIQLQLYGDPLNIVNQSLRSEQEEHIEQALEALRDHVQSERLQQKQQLSVHSHRVS